MTTLPDLRSRETLLTSRKILAAVRKIGPTAAQESYRTSEGTGNAAGHAESASALAEAMSNQHERGDDRATKRTALRSGKGVKFVF
jgi:hypothetical protein